MTTDERIALEPIDIRGRSIPVFVTLRGWFHATANEREFRGESYEELRTRLMEGLKRAAVKVDIPVSILSDSGNIRRLRVTGRHQATRNFLIAGERDQVPSHQRFHQPLSPAEAEIFTQLAEKRKAAIEAFEAFKEARALNVHHVIDELEKAAVNGRDG